jgi:hypothetical protein
MAGGPDAKRITLRICDDAPTLRARSGDPDRRGRPVSPRAGVQRDRHAPEGGLGHADERPLPQTVVLSLRTLPALRARTVFRFAATSAASCWPPFGSAAVIRRLPSSGVVSGIHHTFGVRFPNVFLNAATAPFVQGWSTSCSAARSAASSGKKLGAMICHEDVVMPARRSSSRR